MRANIYIRKDLEEVWKAIPNKSQFLARCIEAELELAIDLVPRPSDYVAPKELEETTEVCPGHSMRWDCGRKGCIYETKF